jgi:hypothetical protein
MRLIPWLGFMVLAPGAAFGQTQPGLPPEAPLPTPPAATLPSFRSEQGVGAETPLATPPAATLPSMLGQPGVGPEAPLAPAPAAPLPSYLVPGAAHAPRTAPADGSTLVVPNGNGTTTIIYPDGSVKTVPTQK